MSWGRRLACFVLTASLCTPAVDEAAARYARGRELLAQQNWAPAAQELEQAVRLNPRNTDAHIAHGVALWGLGKRDEALAAFERATRVSPASAEAHYNVALALRDFGQTDKAAAELKRALKIKPAYEQARLMLALLLQQSGKAEQAVALYKEVLRRNPRSAEAHNWLGVAYLQKNALTEAIAEFRQAIRLKPDYVRAHNNLGSTLAQQGDVEEGVRALEAGLTYAPNDLQLRLNLGMALRARGDADAALEHFNAVLKQRPDDAEVQHQLAQTLRQKGDLEGAVRAFETALALNPELREAYYGLGLTLKQMSAGARAAGTSDAAAEALRAGAEKGRAGDFEAAVEHLRAAVKLAPERADAHYSLGVALWYAGERGESAREVEEALRLNPASPETCSFRALIARETGDLAGARRMLQRAIAVNPKLSAAYFDLGTVFLKLGQTAAAIGQFEAGLNLRDGVGPAPDPQSAIAELRSTDNAGAQYMLGRLLGLAGAEPQQVLAAFERAVRLRPEYAEAHNSIGLVYTQAGDDEKAIAAFREAIRLRPDYADAHGNLGAILTGIDPAEAVRELEKAVALDPASIKAQFNLGLAYGASPAHGAAKEIAQLEKVIAAEAEYPRGRFALGRAYLRNGSVAAAVTHLQKAVQLDPEYGEAHYQLGLALSRAGRNEEAAAELQKGRDLVAREQRSQTAILDLNEGRAALARNQYDTAVDKMRRAVSARPDLAEAHYQLGVALSAKGDREGAQISLRKALELNPGHAGARERLGMLRAPGATDETDVVAGVELQIRQGKFSDAETALKAYVGQRPKSSWGWYAFGYSLFAQQKIGEAIKALSKSLELDVGNAEAHKVLGRSLLLIGRFDAAKLEFEQAARLNPRSAEMPYNLGKLYSIQDNYPEARKAFEEALRLEPEYVEAYDGLGFALESMGEDAAAVASYEKAIGLNESRGGKLASPYVNLASYYNKTGDWDKALTYGRKATDVNANSDRGWFQIGRAQERRGELHAAAEALNRAIAINSHVASYHYVLASVYRRLGKTQESQQALETFTRLDRESAELDNKRRNGSRSRIGTMARPDGSGHE